MTVSCEMTLFLTVEKWTLIQISFIHFADKSDFQDPIGQAELYMRFLQPPEVQTNMSGINRKSYTAGDMLYIEGSASQGFPESKLQWSIGGSSNYYSHIF